MSDGGEIKKGASEALSKAWAELDSDADRMKLACITVHLQEAGLDQANVRQYVDGILGVLSYRRIYDERNFEILDTLLTSTSDKETALNQCMVDLNANKHIASLMSSLTSDKTVASGIDLMLKNDNSAEQWEKLSLHFGLAYQNETLEGQMRAISIIEDAGMNASTFSEKVFEGLTVQDAIRKLEGLNDNKLRTLAAPAFASEFKDIDDILSYLYQCKKMGVQPSECYPKGVEFNLGIAQLGSTEEEYKDTGWLDDTKLLIIRHYEIAEPLEQIKIGEGYDEEQVELSEGFLDEYDGIDKSSPENYECRLDTELLDMVPIEHLPDKIENCTAFISLEGLNMRTGAIQYSSKKITTKYTTYGNSKLVSDVSESPVVSIYEIPAYAYVQMVSLRSYPMAENLYTMEHHIVMPEDIPENHSISEDERENFHDEPNDEFRIYTQASPDKSWDTEIARQMLHEIEKHNWDITQYIIDILYDAGE